MNTFEQVRQFSVDLALGQANIAVFEKRLGEPNSFNVTATLFGGATAKLTVGIQKTKFGLSTTTCLTKLGESLKMERSIHYFALDGTHIR